MAKQEIPKKELCEGFEGFQFCNAVAVVRTIEGPGEWFVIIDDQKMSDRYVPKDEAIQIRDALTEAIKFMDGDI